MTSVLDLVRRYQHVIEKYPNDEQRVLKSIEDLFRLDVKVQHLQETGVGRTVNALRKEPGKVGQAARALVYKWKTMVAAEESDQEDRESSSKNGHNSSDGSEDRDKYADKRSHNHRESNGDVTSKRKYHSSDEDEPNMKKSKHSSSSDSDNYKSKHVKVKSEPPESDSQESESHSGTDEDDTESYSDVEKDVRVKTEPTEKHQSPTKHAHSNHNHVKTESTSSKRSERKDESDSHYSKNNEHISDKSLKSSHHSRDKSSKKDDESTENKYKEKSRDKHKSSIKHSENHKSGSHSSEKTADRHRSRDKSTSDKHGSSKSHKESHKSSSEKDIAYDKHKTKESGSSRDKSTSSKEKSRDRSTSSKEKSSKSEKRHSSSSDKAKNESKSKSDRHEDKNSKKSSSHKSSSSSEKNKSRSSNSKSKEEKPKKKVSINADSDDGIGCESGASFAEALGMVVPAKSKKKQQSTPVKDVLSPSKSSTLDLSPAALLAPTAKLAPLPSIEISALPEISPNYKPRPPPRFMPHFSEEDAMSAVISSKNQRTKVYSGNKVLGRIPTLYEMCVQILQEHIDALEYTGGVPYEILKPVVDKATPQQLFMLEHFNPYLMEDTDHLWQKHCEKQFRNKKRQEMESWREMFMRCQEEQEDKLKSLTANIKLTQEAKKAPIKQTKMAYVDSVVKPPRNIARKQALHGTKFAAAASPAARVAALAGASNVLKGGVRPSPAAPVSLAALNKPKKAPLMQKALQFMRGRKR